MALRLHPDECVDARIVAGVRRRNVDISSALDMDMLGASDERHLQHARDAGRVIVTSDVDFLRMAAELADEGGSHPGVLFLTAGVSVGEAVRAIVLLAEILDPEDMAGWIEWVP
ncbi:MAG: DUF5615 family PIN-like protein [Polyangiaceae bacterium]